MPAGPSTSRFASSTTSGQLSTAAMSWSFEGMALRRPASMSHSSCSLKPQASARARFVSPAFSRAYVTAFGSWLSGAPRGRRLGWWLHE